MGGFYRWKRRLELEVNLGRFQLVRIFLLQVRRMRCWGYTVDSFVFYLWVLQVGVGCFESGDIFFSQRREVGVGGFYLEFQVGSSWCEGLEVGGRAFSRVQRDGRMFRVEYLKVELIEEVGLEVTQDVLGAGSVGSFLGIVIGCGVGEDKFRVGRLGLIRMRCQEGDRTVFLSDGCGVLGIFLFFEFFFFSE